MYQSLAQTTPCAYGGLFNTWTFICHTIVKFSPARFTFAQGTFWPAPFEFQELLPCYADRLGINLLQPRPNGYG